jgi:hypothetical protein
MKFNFKKFGEAIKSKRTDGKATHDKPFSLKSLAEHTGVGYTTICRIEAGKKIASEQLIILSKWASLDLYDFLENS